MSVYFSQAWMELDIIKNFYILLWMEKLYRSHSHRKESQEGLGMREGREIETQTEGRVRARLYAYLQKPASVYNTTQQETERSNAALLQNKNALCVYFPVHFYTRTNRRRAGGAWGGFGMVGLLLVTGYNWWYATGQHRSLQKDTKPLAGLLVSVG